MTFFMENSTMTQQYHPITSLIVIGSNVDGPESEIKIEFGNARGAYRPVVKGKARLRLSISNRTLEVTYDPDMQPVRRQAAVDQGKFQLAISKMQITGNCTVEISPFALYQMIPHEGRRVSELLDLTVSFGAELWFNGEWSDWIVDRAELAAASRGKICFDTSMKFIGVTIREEKDSHVSGVDALRDITVISPSDHPFNKTRAAEGASVTIQGTRTASHIPRVVRSAALEKFYLQMVSKTGVRNSDLIEEELDSDYNPDEDSSSAGRRKRSSRLLARERLLSDEGEEEEDREAEGRRAVEERLSAIHDPSVWDHANMRRLFPSVWDLPESEEEEWRGHHAEEDEEEEVAEAARISFERQQEEEEKRKKAEMKDREEQLERWDKKRKTREEKRSEEQQLPKRATDEEVKKSEEMRCTICMEPETRRGVYTPCGHGTACISCARIWFVSSGSCHMCKAKVEGIIEAFV